MRRRLACRSTASHNRHADSPSDGNADVRAKSDADGNANTNTNLYSKILQ